VVLRPERIVIGLCAGERETIYIQVSARNATTRHGFKIAFLN
jgi:hypothetical protein